MRRRLNPVAVTVANLIVLAALEIVQNFGGIMEASFGTGMEIPRWHGERASLVCR
jgi:hypothetical protein